MNSNSTIIIRIENGAKTKKSPIANSSDKSEHKYTTGQLRAQSASKALVAYDKFVAPFIETAIHQQVSTIELRTGASELQQRIEFGLGVAKQAGGLVTSVLAGFAVGNLPGAIIGGLISGITTVINYANKVRTLRLEENLESITLRGLNTRAGGYSPTSIGSRDRAQ